MGERVGLRMCRRRVRIALAPLVLAVLATATAQILERRRPEASVEINDGEIRVERRLSEVTATNWAQLKSLCEAGGNEVMLSGSFLTYPGQINFSGKTCVIRGNGQTLDAAGAGRFAYGRGSGSSLTLYDLTLQKFGVASGTDRPFEDGGAIYAERAIVVVHRGKFFENKAMGSSMGGAISAESSQVQLSDCEFDGNDSSEHLRCPCSGCPYYRGGLGGGLQINSAVMPSFASNCLFIRNKGFHGAGIRVSGGDFKLMDR